MVFIFDECHRSQFGDMHTLITRKFKRYYIFGFTGTPIFAQNAGTSGNPKLKTTAQAFGDKLHSYTIVDAIRDRNVLPFRVEYISTMKEKKDIENEEVWSIDTDNALKDPRRIRLVTEYIIHHFNQKTKRNDRSFAFNKLMNVSEVATTKRQGRAEEQKQIVRLAGFNSIFAVASIEYAKLYYNEFKRQNSGLKVATIFSYGVNDADDGTGMEDENNEDTDGMLPVDRDFLEKAIQDYNAMFGTNYDTSADKFQNYYKDVSLRMKNREIDLLIVVNMSSRVSMPPPSTRCGWTRTCGCTDSCRLTAARTASSTPSRRLATSSASETSRKPPTTPSPSSATKTLAVLC